MLDLLKKKFFEILVNLKILIKSQAVLIKTFFMMKKQKVYKNQLNFM